MKCLIVCILAQLLDSLPPVNEIYEGYVFTPVCHSVHRGVCLSAWWDTHPNPSGQTLPRTDTPWLDTPYPGQTPPPWGDTPYPGQTPPLGIHPLGRHPLWVYTPGHTPPWGRHPQLGRHPPHINRLPLHSACSDTVNKWAVHILLECILVLRSSQ